MIVSVQPRVRYESGRAGPIRPAQGNLILEIPPVGDHVKVCLKVCRFDRLWALLGERQGWIWNGHRYDDEAESSEALERPGLKRLLGNVRIHQGIVDRQLFERVQAAIQSHRTRARRPDQSELAIAASSAAAVRSMRPADDSQQLAGQELPISLLPLPLAHGRKAALSRWFGPGNGHGALRGRDSGLEYFGGGCRN